MRSRSSSGGVTQKLRRRSKRGGNHLRCGATGWSIYRSTGRRREGTGRDANAHWAHYYIGSQHVEVGGFALSVAAIRVLSSCFARSRAKSANGAVISADRTSQRVISSIRLLGCVGPLRPQLPSGFLSLTCLFQQFPQSYIQTSSSSNSPFSISSPNRTFLRVVWSSSPHSGSKIIPGPPADPCVRFLYSCLYVSFPLIGTCVFPSRPSTALRADIIVRVSIQKFCHPVLQFSRADARARFDDPF